MRKITLSLSATVISCCFCISAIAQTDSSWLDLGSIKLRKDFTQSISIKPQDLEKTPFSNLSEAINVWLYGFYSNHTTLLYVVDGNPFNDVNNYSIYDIEDIIYIQNALIQLNGAIGQQQLVIIITKKNGHGKSGLLAAVNASLVNRNLSNIYPGENLHSNTNFYHQYCIGGYKNFNKISVGVSANYLRDVMPSVKADSIDTSTPYNLNRFRFTGYCNMKFSNKNDIYIGLGYTTEKVDSAQSYFITSSFSGNKFFYNNSARQHQNIFTPVIKWQSEFLPGLKNELQFSYVTSSYKPASSLLDSSGVGINSAANTNVGSQLTNYCFIRDNINYDFHAGAWNIEPSLDASYEYNKQATTESSATSYDNYYYTVAGYTESQKIQAYFLTPAVNIFYKDIFNIEGGIKTNIHSNPSLDSKKVFSFATMSLDILKFFNTENKSSFKLFGSYAQPSSLISDGALLNDLTTANSFYSSGNPSGYFIQSNTTSIGNPSVNTDYSIWEAGAAITLFSKRLHINYNFEKRGFTAEELIPIPISAGYQSEIIFPFFKSSTNSINITTTVIEKKFINWQSGINATSINSTIDSPYATILTYVPINNIVGDYNTSHPSWTGGWTNRIRYKNFSAGIDMSYHFNEAIINNNVTKRINSIALQNIYVGYILHTAKTKSVEIYINSRDLLQNNYSDLTDGRRYYGAGSKIAF